MATQDMKRLLKALWIKACRYDGIDPKAKFVVMSDNNPYEKRRQKLLSLCFVAYRNGKLSEAHTIE